MKYLFLALMLLASPAMAAGTVVLDDSINALSAEQVANVTNQKDWPFDAKIIVANYATKSAQDATISACVDQPNKVCIGVDPKLRAVSVHYGTGTGVPKYDYNAIAAAGNAYFKQGNWGDGLIAIGNKAARSVQIASSPQPAVPVSEPAKTSSSSSTMPTLALIFVPLGLLALALGLYALYRRQKKLDQDMGSFREERNEMALTNGENLIKKDAVTAKTIVERRPLKRTSTIVSPSRRRSYFPSPAPAPAPVVVNNSNDGFLTGFMVGQATSHPSPAPSPSPSPSFSWPSPSPSPSRDSDSGSSSWGGSGGSSFDSGGGSSDFGGSGGFDGGGGGSDF